MHDKKCEWMQQIINWKINYSENIVRFKLNRNTKCWFPCENAGIRNEDSKGSTEDISCDGCKSSYVEEKELSIAEKGQE